MTGEPRQELFDAAVIGGGPAGAATARWLALRGHSVVLFERTKYVTPRIGESLPPQIQAPLRELGVWQQFKALGPLPSWGTRSVWGNAEPQSHTHLHSPYGCGWHIDRRAFDRLLADAAVAAGARLVEGVAVRDATYEADRWIMRPATFEGARSIMCARVIVDATGRSAQVARRLGARRLPFDRLVGVAVPMAGTNVAERGFLFVETMPEGWWYSAPLPDSDGVSNAMIAMLMTDADICARLALTTTPNWSTALRATSETSRRIAPGTTMSRPRVHCAQSHRLSRAAGEGSWLAVGDAALAVDPVSGSGVLRALGTARSAAKAVCKLLLRPDLQRDTLDAYEDELDEECTKFLFERAQYYGLESRFDAPFWQRRRQMK